MRDTFRLACAFLLLLVAAGSASPLAMAAVVVEQVADDGPAAAAGLRAGDVLLTWSRAANPPLHPARADGTLSWPVDWSLLDTERHRGDLLIRGRRGDARLSWTFARGEPDWGLDEIRPDLEQPSLLAWQRAREGLEAEDPSSAVEDLQGLAEALKDSGEPSSAAWMLDAGAAQLDAAGRVELSAALQADALAALGPDPNVRVLAALHERAGARFRARRDWDHAAREYGIALALLEERARQDLGVANLLRELGDIAESRAHLAADRAEMEEARLHFSSAEELHRRSLAIREEVLPGSLSVARSLVSLAFIAMNLRGPAAAEHDAQRALTIAEELAPGSPLVAGILGLLGNIALHRGDLASADDLHRGALAINERLQPGSLAVGHQLQTLGWVAQNRGDFAAAADFFGRALTIQEKLLPGGADHAASLHHLGDLAFQRGKLAEARDYLRRSLELQETFIQGPHPGFAATLEVLGNVMTSTGDLAAGEDLYRRALAMSEAIHPDSGQVAGTLGNLSIVARYRGNLAEAEELNRRTLAWAEKHAPDSLLLAHGLQSLGDVLAARGDRATSADLHRRSLGITEKLAPGTLQFASDLARAAAAAQRNGDLAAAEVLIHRALAIKEEIVPGSLQTAASLASAGSMALSREDFETAEGLFRRALAIQEEIAPDSLDCAASLGMLGEVALLREDLAAAEGLFRRAVAIEEKLAPGSSQEASSLHSLAELRSKQGRIGEAVEYLRRSLGALTVQVGRLGGSEHQRTGFAEGYADWHRELIDLLVRLDRPAEAFETLDNSRGRRMVSMLSARDLVFAVDVPRELERERAIVNASYERTQAEIAELHPAKDRREIDDLLRRLRELRDERDAIGARIRQASPRLADLRDPEPRSLKGMQATLDPGTLALAYSVGREKTHLFAVTRRGLSTHELPMKREALAGRVRDLRSGIISGANATRGGDALRTLSESLSDDLLLPVADQIADADRLLLLPDGPLHYLPFAVLATPGTGSAERRPYLIESLPLHCVVSMGVYAQVRQDAGRARPMRVAALGDPDYSTATETPRLASLLRGVASATTQSAATLTRLPATRTEVEALDALFGESASTWLGAAATEERARQLGPEYTVVHFAMHGLINEQFPLDSALAFSMPPADDVERENGLLQAWEIFESLRLDADLVTLSACETALGKETGGEGIVGLTRAFHYAGASSVLSSLWSVSDASTAELMKRFYGHLSKGAPKDEALRAAQLELLRGPLRLEDDDPTRGIKGVSRPSGGNEGHQSRQEPAVREMDATHPFYWAAFVLSGDWN